MNTIVQRVQVVAGSVITLCVALAIAVERFVAELAPELPSGWQDNAVTIGGVVVAWLAAAIAGLRRVTEVAPEERGLLPPSKPL